MTARLARIGRDTDPDADQARRELELRAIHGPREYTHLAARVQAAQAAAAFCRSAHRQCEALGLIAHGRVCSPHCTLYGPAVLS